MARKGVFCAPGRVNLIGEHTDYNGGLVLPLAIEQRITLQAKVRNDRQVFLFARDLNEKASSHLDRLFPLGKKTWANYLLGVLQEIQKAGFELKGMEIEFSGNIPRGAGLSSSAALEAATALAINELFALELPPLELAKISQKAENNFVGVSCGLMDQMASLLSREKKLLLIDFSSLDFKYVPWPEGEYSLVICDSKKERQLYSSAYNDRHNECREALDFYTQKLNKPLINLSQLSLEEIADLSAPTALKKRTEHVLTENKRVKEAQTALQKENWAELGELLTQSHKSLRDDFQVSSPELDFLVDSAINLPGCLGARLTGAGFGGCTISLVENQKIPGFYGELKEKYYKKTGKKADLYVTRPQKGAKIM